MKTARLLTGIIGWVLMVVGSNGLLGAVAGAQQQDEKLDFNTRLIQSTFQIVGEGSQGTSFLIGRPYPDNPTKLRYTLVTAAHVLQGMKGEFAIVLFRRRIAGSAWETLPTPIQIRQKDAPLWVQHPSADVAAIYIAVPENANVTIIPTALLGNDDLLSKYEIHPGDTLNALGYPLGVKFGTGLFPVLRSGQIASYPLLPTRETKTFYMDFPIFKGNSGGPVYIYVSGSRIYAGAMHVGAHFGFVMGLVSKEVNFSETFKGVYSTSEQSVRLGLAEIVHGVFIKETVELLPEPTQ